MATVQTERLFNLLCRAKAAADPEVKIALTRLAEETRERKSRGGLASGDFFYSALRAVSNLRGTSNSELRMSCLYDCAYFFFHKGQSERALRAVRELIQLTNLVQNPFWLCKANTIAGVIHADLGNISEAFAYDAAALIACREQGDSLAEAKVMVNLGVALNYGGLYREAIPCFLSVASISNEKRSGQRTTCHSSVNLAQSYFYLEDFENGFNAACDSLRLSQCQ